MSRVLAIDDHEREEERYRAFLAPDEYEVVVCGVPEQALRIAFESSPPIEVAIVLWELTGPPTGAELIKRLVSSRPDLPVIAVSGHLDRSRAAAAEKLGAKDFLLKPLEGDRLLKSIDMLVHTEPDSPMLDALRSRMIGQSRVFQRTLRHLATAIPDHQANVLLIGESGTGKELLARAVHELGPDAKEPWLPVNLTAIPEILLESHLFGHEPGAFTGAKGARKGFFEESGSGTLFLDEIGELDVHLQAKLLRVIEERSFRRLGSSEDRTFSARLVTATNRDLAVASREGKFRPDLYYRLATHEIHLPPLRERRDDLWLLVDYYLAARGEARNVELGREAKHLLSEYPFPGNVRELEDLVQCAILRCDGDTILPYHLPLESLDKRSPEPVPDAASAETSAEISFPERLLDTGLKEATEEMTIALDQFYLPRVLADTGHVLSKAAKRAGVDKNTFKARWQRAGLGVLPWQE